MHINLLSTLLSLMVQSGIIFNSSQLLSSSQILGFQKLVSLNAKAGKILFRPLKPPIHQSEWPTKVSADQFCNNCNIGHMYQSGLQNPIRAY